MKKRPGCPGLPSPQGARIGALHQHQHQHQHQRRFVQLWREQRAASSERTAGRTASHACPCLPMPPMPICPGRVKAQQASRRTQGPARTCFKCSESATRSRFHTSPTPRATLGVELGRQGCCAPNRYGARHTAWSTRRSPGARAATCCSPEIRDGRILLHLHLHLQRHLHIPVDRTPNAGPAFPLFTSPIPFTTATTTCNTSLYFSSLLFLLPRLSSPITTAPFALSASVLVVALSQHRFCALISPSAPSLRDL
ncbi:hypothetical protein N431DRAFT_170407 [Stipitochalara longipes BDJ]|nr:hypothetical protein N431DRAFT_170407 [Stipitochalara longipes BDJ]